MRLGCGAATVAGTLIVHPQVLSGEGNGEGSGQVAITHYIVCYRVWWRCLGGLFRGSPGQEPQVLSNWGSSALFHTL